jgi:hypothetical protein
MEFATKFLQFLSLGTSIYRLQVQTSVWLDNPRRCHKYHIIFGTNRI